MARACVGIVFELIEGDAGVGSRSANRFELSGTAPVEPRAKDWDVEYEPERTICALEGALRRLDCEPVRIGTPHDLLRAAGESAAGPLHRLDAALTIAEGYGSRNREAWAPVLLEMLGIPTLGSDALTLSLSLDKAWCTTMVSSAGVPTPPQLVVERIDELEDRVLPMAFPLFVKPRWEGTAKGITPGSCVSDGAALARAVEFVVSTYQQPALVEPFLPGAEYTVTVVGNTGQGRGARALPVLQRALEVETGIGVHALERHDPAVLGRACWEHVLPGELSPALEARLTELSLRVYGALECKDFSRIDFRLDAQGEPLFLEINTLPTFDPEASFGIFAELEGRSVEELLAEVFGEGLARLGVLRP